MAQNGQNGQNDLIPNKFSVFRRQTWTKVVHFGLFWPEEVHFGPFGSANHTLATPDNLQCRPQSVIQSFRDWWLSSSTHSDPVISCTTNFCNGLAGSEGYTEKQLACRGHGSSVETSATSHDSGAPSLASQKIAIAQKSLHKIVLSIKSRSPPEKCQF